MSNQLVLKNQFGEESINQILSSGTSYLAGFQLGHNIIVFEGATAPVDGTTGDDVAAKGSLYIARDTGAVYYNSGVIGAPVWTAIGSGSTATLLTGFSAAAGVVAASDTVLVGFNKLAGSVADLKNGKITPSSETVAAAGALSTTVCESVVNNASGGSIAVTLAAPSSQDGQLKIIKFGTATNSATLAMTNIKGPGFCTLSGTTTLTFSVTGQSAILMAVGAKWMLIGGDAVAS